jgi:hypothetical protein
MRAIPPARSLRPAFRRWVPLDSEVYLASAFPDRVVYLASAILAGAGVLGVRFLRCFQPAVWPSFGFGGPFLTADA